MTRARRLRRFVRTPKGLLLVILILLAIVAGRVEGLARALPGVVAAMAAAAVFDAVALRVRQKRWAFPTGALLTGLIVALVLSVYEPWYVFAAASAVGVAAKYVLRTRSANVCNPAALGLVVVFHGFDTAQNWWGAMPAIVPAAAWPILLAAGLLVVARVDKLPLVLAFCATYFALFATATFVVEPRDVAEIFSGPDLLAAAFFASFMLTDPPTSPTRYQPQVACGILTAVVAVAVFLRIGTADYLLDGVLVANVFEAGRRWQAGRRRTRYASSIRSGCAPCQSAATPSSCNCSSPRSMVRKWLPAS